MVSGQVVNEPGRTRLFIAGGIGAPAFLLEISRNEM